MPEEKSLLDLANKHLKDAKESMDAPNVPQRPASNQRQESNDIKETLESLLSKVNEKTGWVDVELPSKGYLNENCDGTVQLKPFTFEDEKTLRSVMGISDGVAAIATLMQRCTKGVPYEELSLVDKSFILFKLREMSYGSAYPIQATCGQCTESNELTVNLAEIPVEYAKGPIEDPKAVFLPDSEVTIFVTHPRTRHEALLEDFKRLTDNLWKFVDNVEGHTDRGIIQQFIAKTTAKDIAVLRQGIFDTDLGLQTKVHYICAKCGSDEVVELPLNENFFVVN
jgi:hypothetical protein